MTDPRESRFCELLEQPELSEPEWQELEDLARALDIDDAFEACYAAIQELEAGLSAPLH